MCVGALHVPFPPCAVLKLHINQTDMKISTCAGSKAGGRERLVPYLEKNVLGCLCKEEPWLRREKA